MWAISETQGSWKGHQQIWEALIVYHTCAQKWCMANLGSIVEREKMHVHKFGITFKKVLSLWRFHRLYTSCCMYKFWKQMSVPQMFPIAWVCAVAACRLCDVFCNVLNHIINHYTILYKYICMCVYILYIYIIIGYTGTPRWDDLRWPSGWSWLVTGMALDLPQYPHCDWLNWWNQQFSLPKCPFVPWLCWITRS